mmetsp:Transcript_68900/g.128636  ORF Transcript_68900/g.128636 Transcript_68900/m.128636 type:complete len:225 (+) Transcript_68900:157-831(+)
MVPVVFLHQKPLAPEAAEILAEEAVETCSLEKVPIQSWLAEPAQAAGGLPFQSPEQAARSLPWVVAELNPLRGKILPMAALCPCRPVEAVDFHTEPVVFPHLNSLAAETTRTVRVLTRAVGRPPVLGLTQNLPVELAPAKIGLCSCRSLERADQNHPSGVAAVLNPMVDRILSSSMALAVIDLQGEELRPTQVRCRQMRKVVEGQQEMDHCPHYVRIGHLVHMA